MGAPSVTPSTFGGISQFYWYGGYFVQPTDMTNLQTWTQQTVGALAAGGFGASLLKGYTPTVNGGASGMILSVAPGIAFNVNGSPLVLSAATGVTVATPVGNAAWSLIVARPTPYDYNYIQNPLTQPAANVPLNNALAVSVVCINGTPASSPSYPSAASGDVVLVGLKIPEGTTQLASGMFDFSQAYYSSQGTVTSITFTGDGTVLSATPTAAVTSNGTLTATLNQHASGTFLAGPSSGANANPTFRVLGTTDFVAPTIQTFNSSSGTYTTPTSPRVPLYIEVEMVGGGGGGGGSSASGGSGGNSTFGTTLLVANGGTGGAQSGNSTAAAAGGTASLGSGPIGRKYSGGSGGGGSNMPATSEPGGGPGGNNPLGGGGGGGSGGSGTTGTAGAGADNTGGGGGGAGGDQPSIVVGGGGGGAGGYVKAIISSPSSTYAYAVGAAGTAGTGTTVGGAGGSGGITVREFYQ